MSTPANVNKKQRKAQCKPLGGANSSHLSCGGAAPARLACGRVREGVSFPAPPSHAALPADYAATLNEIKQRIRTERVRVDLAANAAMVLLYWEIGRIILARQQAEGWGAKVIDRLSADLRAEFPDMHGLSPRTLKYMRAFAAAWPDRAIVQEALAQIPWYHHIALLEKCRDAEERLWYARQAAAQGWSHSMLSLNIDRQLYSRHGRAVTNFAATLPPADSDLAAQVFKDPYLFDFLSTADHADAVTHVECGSASSRFFEQKRSFCGGHPCGDGSPIAWSLDICYCSPAEAPRRHWRGAVRASAECGSGLRAAMGHPRGSGHGSPSHPRTAKKHHDLTYGT